MHLNTVLLMSGGAVKVLQFFAALSLLIVLHEFGHFFFARLFKTRVEKFYLFFDFFLNITLFKKKIGDTVYGIGWLPLGGYVKIAGMMDESMDKEAMALPPQPWEYRSKKPYQRLLIMLGGIIVNVLLAIVIYIAVFSIYGEEYLPAQNATYGIMADSLAKSIGLHNGDKIISMDGKPVTRFEKITLDMILYEGKSFQVLRDGQTVNVNIPAGTERYIIKGEQHTFIEPRTPIVVDEVSKGSAAAKMDLQHGDSVIAINSVPVQFYDQFDSTKRSLAGNPITLTVIRGGRAMDLSGTVPTNKMLGFVLVRDPQKFFVLEKIKYNPIQAIGKGFTYTYEQFTGYLQNLKLLFTSKEVKVSENVGGLISIGKIFPAEFDMQRFLMLVAILSIMLAFTNLLPIPGLDGGHVMFLLFEMITGVKVSEKVMERATTVGFVFLIALMVYVNGLDVFRLFKK